jgi:integrase
MARGLIEQNPVTGTQVVPEEARERVLSLTQLAAVWRACGDDAYGSIVRALVLTGQRREEIGGLRHDEIFDGVVVLPPHRTKNGRTHLVPLSAQLQAILARQPEQAGDFVFGAKPFVSWSYGKRLLDTALDEAGVKLEPWTLHDLRRSVATGMAELGVQPHIVEAVLNHVSGHKAGIAGIYNRATYEKEKRAGLAMWAEHVTAAVDRRTATVVPIRA